MEFRTSLLQSVCVCVGYGCGCREERSSSPLEIRVLDGSGTDCSWLQFTADSHCCVLEYFHKNQLSCLNTSLHLLYCKEQHSGVMTVMMIPCLKKASNWGTRSM